MKNKTYHTARYKLKVERIKRMQKEIPKGGIMKKNRVKQLLETYKQRVKKDYLSLIDKGLIITYLEEFVKDLTSCASY